MQPHGTRNLSQQRRDRDWDNAISSRGIVPYRSKFRELGLDRLQGSASQIQQGEVRQSRFVDGDPSRLVLRQHLRPPRFGFAPSGVDVCERLPVGVVNPVRRPAAMRNISEWMEHVILACPEWLCPP
jgi:hypothetical protein